MSTGKFYNKYLMFHDNYGSPLPDYRLEAMLQEALKVENYELCQLIKEEREKRERIKRFNYGYIK